ncbi:MAG: hypothetical protein ACP5QA_16895 [Phycisphaerae bacterium]
MIILLTVLIAIGGFATGFSAGVSCVHDLWSNRVWVLTLLTAVITGMIAAIYSPLMLFDFFGALMFGYLLAIL